MLLPATNLRKGMIIRYDKVPHLVTQASHVVTGRGGANIQSKLKNLVTGRNAEYRWSSDEKFEEIELDQFPMEYLYQDGDHYCFMNTENFEQILIGKEVLGDAVFYLVPNIQVRVFMHDGQPLSIALPNEVTLAVTETGPNVKGSTVTASTKPATCETGLVVQVPLFVETGEKIIVLTSDGSYESRAKE